MMSVRAGREEWNGGVFKVHGNAEEKDKPDVVEVENILDSMMM